MEVTFKRNMSRNFAILSLENPLKENYQMHILLENQVSGLLPCKVQWINGQEYLYYEITGSQSLENLYEKGKFNQETLRGLFLQVIAVLEHLDEYLLNRDFLILNPKYIYKNLDQDTYSFFWFPEQKNTVEQEFCTLTEYLLPKIDYKDKGAVTIGYGMHKLAVENSIQPDCLRQLLYEEKEEQKIVFEVEKEEGQEKREKILDDFYKDEEEETPIKKTFIAGIFLLLVGVLFLVRYLSNMGIRYVGIVAVLLIIFVTVMGVIVYVLYTRKEDLEKDCSMPFENMEIIEKEESEENEEKEEGQEDFGKTVLLQSEFTGQACLLEVATGKKFFLEKETIIIGSQKEMVDIYLNSPTISRIHAKIVNRGHQIFLIDLNSRNGTELDGEILQPEREYLLRTENMITFAEKKYMYFDKYSADFEKIW